MQSILIEKLRAFMINNNPELIIKHDEGYSLTEYLEQKVQEIEPLLNTLIAEGKSMQTIEELCLQEMTKELRPSRFHYIRNILKESFNRDFSRFKETGTLTSKTVELIDHCQKLFSSLGLSESTENDPKLKKQVTHTIEQFLKG